MIVSITDLLNFLFQVLQSPQIHIPVSFDCNARQLEFINAIIRNHDIHKTIKTFFVIGKPQIILLLK